MPTSPSARRAFYLNQCNPNNAPRMAPTVRAIRALLSNGRPHEYGKVVSHGLAASDLKEASVKTFIAGAVAAGMIRKAGSYRRSLNTRTKKWVVKDTRVLGIGDWPLHG